MRKNPTYMALLGPTRLLISEKSDTYPIKWSYTIIWQVRVDSQCLEYLGYITLCWMRKGIGPWGFRPDRHHAIYLKQLY